MNILLKGYFEDKRYYEPNRQLIKSWFPYIPKKNNKDLVFHFRTGDRLFYKNEFDSKPKSDKIKKRPDQLIRNYGIGAQIIKSLKIKNMILVTRSPKKVVGLEGFDIKIVKQEIIK